MINKKIIFIAFPCALLFASLVANEVLFFNVVKNNKLLQRQEEIKRVLDFRNMFTQNVLLSEKEIDFDTRLSMETAVRNLNDQEIFLQWQKFTNSQTKEDATAQAKKMLSLLIERTSK